MSNRTNLKRVLVWAIIGILVAVGLAQSAEAGSIVSWGKQRFDSRDFENAQFQAIAAGYAHSLALTSDGALVGWGNDLDGQASPPVGNDFVAIEAGGFDLVAKS